MLAGIPPCFFFFLVKFLCSFWARIQQRSQEERDSHRNSAQFARIEASKACGVGAEACQGAGGVFGIRKAIRGLEGDALSSYFIAH